MLELATKEKRAADAANEPARDRGRRGIEVLALVFGFAVAAYLVTSPLFGDPTSTVLDVLTVGSWFLRPGTDYFLWAVSWDWHALTSEATLAAANILPPSEAASEAVFPRLGHLPIFGPLLAITGNAIAAHQINLWAGLTLSAASMSTLLRYWGCGWPAAVLGGLVYGLCPARIVGMATPAVVAGQYLPLAVLFLDRAARSGGWRDAALAAFFLAWQASCAPIYCYVVPVVALSWLISARDGTACLRLLGVTALSLFAVAWLLWPLVDGLERGHVLDWVPPDEQLGVFAAHGAVSWSDFVTTPAGGAASDIAIALPPGIGLAGLLLAVSGVWGTRARHARWSLVCCAVGAGYLALGPSAPAGATVWKWLQPVFPLNVVALLPSHFALLFVTAASALLGIGADRWLSRLQSTPRRVLVTAALTAFVAWECGHLGGRALAVVGRNPYPSAVYEALADRPNGAVFEVPFRSCRSDRRIDQALAMSDSRHHWRPLLNGYGDLDTRYRAEIVALMDLAPDPRAVDLLRRITDLRHVVAYAPRMSVAERNAWLGLPEAREIAFRDNRLLVEIGDARAGDLRSRFLALEDEATTLLGYGVGEVPEVGRRAHVTVDLSEESYYPGISFAASVTVENRSSEAWPVLGGASDSRVRLVYRWLSADSGEPLHGRGPKTVPLPFGLAPGESVTVTVCVTPPLLVGQELVLQVGVAQGKRGAEWFGGTRGRAAVHLVAYRPGAEQ